MAMFTTQLGVVGSGANLKRSLDMISSGKCLSMSDGNFGSYSGQKFAISAAIKRSVTGVINSFIFAQGSGTAATTSFYLDISASPANTLELAFSNGSSISAAYSTTLFTSTSTWYHIYVEFDSTQASSSNRIKMWTNGVQETVTGSMPSLNQALNNSSLNVAWGGDSNGTSTARGLLFRPAFFSGALPGISGVYSGGIILDVRGQPGLKSHLYTTSSSTLEDDYVLSTNWTNNGGVAKSLVVPL